MTGREILTQKLRGVRRLQWVCSIPVFSAIGLQAWWRYQLYGVGLWDATSSRGFPDYHYLWWEYLLGALVSVVIYSELVKWISLWCGLMIRNSMRAILMSVLAIAAISILPYLAIWILAYINPPVTQIFQFVFIVLRCMNPWLFIAMNEASNMRQLFSIPLIPALINAATQGGMLWLIHRHLMHRADWYLGRIGVPGAVKSPPVGSAEDLRHGHA